MRILGSLLTLTLLAIAVIGCGGGPKSLQSASEGDIPDWFNNLPQDPNYIFAAKTASSQDMQLAIDKAATDARAEIGRTVELKLQNLTKKFREDVGVGEGSQYLEQMTDATKTVVSTSLSGSRIKTQKQSKDGNVWRAYVLAEYPIGAANEAFIQQIRKNDQMYARFRSTQTFKELDDEVQKYEEWKKQQKETPK